MVRGRLLGLLLALVATLALLGTGCGEHRSQEAPDEGTPAARLVATAGYGAEGLLDTHVKPGQSVMRALRGATEVETAYAGDFVSRMLERDSDLGGGRDWFFFVDGISSEVGATQVGVAAGDEVWWDYRSWRDAPEAQAVVGSWPLPFARPGGDPLPAVAADPPLAEPLRRAGARIASGDSPWRVRVGASAALARRDPAWASALRDPERLGMLAAISGGRVVALDAKAQRMEPVAGARAVALALPTGGPQRASQGVLLAVAGLDRASAQAAAERIARDPAVLARRYAVVFDGRGNPLRAPGRSGP